VSRPAECLTTRSFFDLREDSCCPRWAGPLICNLTYRPGLAASAALLVISRQFFVHKNFNLNLPLFHSLTVSNFRLHPSGQLSWNRMKGLSSQPDCPMPLQYSAPFCNQKKNSQLQKIGFVWSNRQWDVRPSVTRAASPPAALPPCPCRNWLRFVKRSQIQTPNQKKNNHFQRIGFVWSGGASKGLLAYPFRRVLAASPIHRPFRLPASFQELASFRQLRPLSKPEEKSRVTKNWLRLVKPRPITTWLSFFDRCEDLSCQQERAFQPATPPLCGSVGQTPSSARDPLVALLQSPSTLNRYRTPAPAKCSRPPGKAIGQTAPRRPAGRL